MNSPYNSVLQTALRKKAEGRGMKNSEIGAITRSRIPNRPVANNYRPLGAIVNQIPDRIHSLQDPNGPDAAPFVFDNELHFDDGTTRIDIDGAGVVVTKGGVTTTMNENGLQVVDESDNLLTLNGGSLQFTSADTGKTLEIDAGDIAHDMGIKAFVGCNSGTPGNYDTIASDFY